MKPPGDLAGERAGRGRSRVGCRVPIEGQPVVEGEGAEQGGAGDLLPLVGLVQIQGRGGQRPIEQRPDPRLQGCVLLR